MHQLSRAAENLIGQPMFAFLSQVKALERSGKKIIHFEIGDPHFETPPQVVAAAKKSLDNGETHYTDSMGLWDLRQEIRHYAEKEWGFMPDVGQVLVSPANALIDFTIRTLVNPGEEIIYPDPGFPTYSAVISYAGMRGVPVPILEENNFRMRAHDVKEKMSSKTRLIIINSPNNPTGSIMSEEDTREIYALAKRYNCSILTDEVYRSLSEMKPFSVSALDHCHERTIILYSFSKIFAMSGWRLGFAIAPQSIATKLGLMLETILSCVPVFTQRGGIAALHVKGKELTTRYQELKRRKDALITGLNTLAGVRCIYPDGAFYAFANIRGTGLSSAAFRDLMLDQAGVSVLDGTAFGKQGEGFARLSYASATVPMIEEAIKKMSKVLGASAKNKVPLFSPRSGIIP
ncbi:MAG: aminotransferase class I/II-fold pyridoxal phosphate-dependent enzyme [bacterium]|nr:aminotransferase class I/II-fold pyridoxal phosphate-dependent enzyme [bacterium]